MGCCAPCAPGAGARGWCQGGGSGHSWSPRTASHPPHTSRARSHHREYRAAAQGPAVCAAARARSSLSPCPSGGAWPGAREARAASRRRTASSAWRASVPTRERAPPSGIWQKSHASFRLRWPLAISSAAATAAVESAGPFPGCTHSTKASNAERPSRCCWSAAAHGSPSPNRMLLLSQCEPPACSWPEHHRRGPFCSAGGACVLVGARS